MARGIFEEQTNLEKLVQKIMLDAQGLLKCEKCCVYLLEDTCERVSFPAGRGERGGGLLLGWGLKNELCALLQSFVQNCS